MEMRGGLWVQGVHLALHGQVQWDMHGALDSSRGLLAYTMCWGGMPMPLGLGRGSLPAPPRGIPRRGKGGADPNLT